MNCATSAAGPAAKRPLRETGDFLVLTPRFLTQSREEAKVFQLGLGKLREPARAVKKAKIGLEFSRRQGRGFGRPQNPRCQPRVDVKCFGRFSMSEFKYACPVCGQHMSCDSSQSGSVMECPTCFQKITVPQAPAAGDQKFILTGSKVSEKKYSLPKDVGSGVTVEKKSPVTAFLSILLILAATAAGVFFYIKQHPAGQKSKHKPATAIAAALTWQTGDIGAVGVGGSMSQSNDVFTINGGGADIWHQADGFYYVYQTLDGDGSLTAEVLNLKNTDEWAKAGVMIRESTNASSAFVLASQRADGQAQSIWRNAAGQEAQASELSGGPGFPKWVKMVRNGNRFSAYFKATADDDWTQMGATQTVEMSPSALIGFFVCSHHEGIVSQAQFDQTALETVKNGKPAKAVVKQSAPPANGTTWTLNLDAANHVPEAAVAGRIHGQDFICGRSLLQGGTLTWRGNDNMSLAINFGGATPDALAGQTFNVTTNADTVARVTLHWEEAGQREKETFTNHYALRLELGAPASNLISGKIYFCAPDVWKSYVRGTFTAEIRKAKVPKPKKIN